MYDLRMPATLCKRRARQRHNQKSFTSAPVVRYELPNGSYQPPGGLDIDVSTTTGILAAADDGQHVSHACTSQAQYNRQNSRIHIEDLASVRIVAMLTQLMQISIFSLDYGHLLKRFRPTDLGDYLPIRHVMLDRQHDPEMITFTCGNGLYRTSWGSQMDEG